MHAYDYQEHANVCFCLLFSNIALRIKIDRKVGQEYLHSKKDDVTDIKITGQYRYSVLRAKS